VDLDWTLTVLEQWKASVGTGCCDWRCPIETCPNGILPIENIT